MSHPIRRETFSCCLLSFVVCRPGRRYYFYREKRGLNVSPFFFPNVPSLAKRGNKKTMDNESRDSISHCGRFARHLYIFSADRDSFIAHNFLFYILLCIFAPVIPSLSKRGITISRYSIHYIINRPIGHFG